VLMVISALIWVLGGSPLLAEIRSSSQANQRSKVYISDGQYKGSLLLATQLQTEITNHPDRYPIGTILHVTQVQSIWNNNKRCVASSLGCDVRQKGIHGVPLPSQHPGNASWMQGNHHLWLGGSRPQPQYHWQPH
jgi:hypothetical protein